MDGKQAADAIRTEQKFFLNVIGGLESKDGDFRPTPEMMTAAQQVQHVATTLDWFREGAFGSGFEMDFEKLEAANRKPCTLDEAREALEASYERMIATMESKSAEEMMAPLPENPIFGPMPRIVIIHANSDHTAHHRGALSVYLRLLGKTPKMPYGD
jgi:uncharacterized damage-inducible protein DinB